MRQVWILFWGCIFVPAFASGAITINEVMYDPGQCPDSVCEWIELYNNGTEEVNLTNCQLDGRQLTGKLASQDYLIVATNIANFTAAFGSVANLLQMPLSLRNNGENISLSGNSNCTDLFDYTNFISVADGNNKTLERRLDSTWGESRIQGGTPGFLNSLANTSLDFAMVEISEILANPHDEDHALKPLGEWVELHNKGGEELDLRSLFFEDEAGGKLYLTNDKVLSPGGAFLPPYGYLVVYSDGDSDFSLNNNGRETVSLKNRDIIVDLVSYSDTTEGMSLSKLAESWYLTLPTEGTANEFTEGCDWFLLLNLSESISRPEDFEFGISINRFFGFENRNITVKGKIEDINGKVIREYAPWTSDPIASYSSRRYSPNLKDGIYQVVFWIEDLECNDVDASDNIISRLVAVNPQHRQFDSLLSIEKITAGKGRVIEWGDAVLVEIYAYRGNTSKSTLKLWAEHDGQKASTVSTLSFPKSFTEYRSVIPIQLFPRCDQEDADAEKLLLHLEGLGRENEESFLVKGSDRAICTELKDEDSSAPTSASKLQYLLLDSPAGASPGSSFPVRVHLINDEKDHIFTVWGWVYRGSKCYSCRESQEEKDHLARDVFVERNGEKIVDIPLLLDSDMEEGEYKVKASIVKDHQKTSRDLISSLQIKWPEQSRSDSGSLLAATEANEGEPLVELSPAQKTMKDRAAGIVVYESNSQKTRRLIPIIIAGSLGLLCIILALRK